MRFARDLSTQLFITYYLCQRKDVMFVPLLFVRLSVCVSAKITRKAVIGFDEIFLDGWGMAERFW